MMDAADLFAAMATFLAALRLEAGTERFRGDRRVFANLVEELRKTNTFAASFTTYNTVAGKDCPEFAQGLSSAYGGGFVQHVSGVTASYLIAMSPRVCRETLDDLTDLERSEVSLLAKAYAEECRWP